MELTFEFTQSVVSGSQPKLVHTADNIAQIIFVKDGQIQYVETNTPYGDWSEREFGPVHVAAADDEGIDSLSLSYLASDQLWFMWVSGNDVRIAPWPDTSPPYILEDPYRLYYAVDTEKLYMNINQRWVFIASLKHTLLKEVGEKTHPELDLLAGVVSTLTTQVETLETQVEDLEGRVEILEGGTP